MNFQALRLAAVSATAVAAVLTASAANAQSGGASTTPADAAIPGGNQPTPETSAGNAPAPAEAQAEPGEGDRVTLGDIVVTARKRAAGEALQATPVSATAVGGAELQQANAVNIVDVGKLSPGVSFQASSTRSVGNFSIRGVGVNGSTPSDEPAVGIFQDGIYWGSNTGALGEMFDMESVEVLRGPQGTLFGRNVTGGAIVLHTARPTFTPFASISGGYGWRNSIDGSAIISGPVVGDTVAVRLGASYRTTDGYWNWAVKPGEAYGVDNVLLVRPSILIKPHDGLELIVRGEYYKQFGDPVPVRGLAVGRFPNANQNAFPRQAGYVTDDNFYNVWSGGQVPLCNGRNPTFQVAGRPTCESVADRGRNNVTIYLASAELNADVGPGVLTFVNGYRQVIARTRQDYDGFPTLSFNSNSVTDQHQFSSELRYAANINDFVDFTIGGFYFHQAFQYYDSRFLAGDDATRPANATTNPALISNPANVLVQKADLRYNDGWAVFAEADFKITPELTVTLGGRYTDDRKAAQIAPYTSAVRIPAAGPGCAPFTYTNCNYGPIRRAVDKKFTPKVGVSFQFTPDNLLFASYTQGIRSGGYALRGAALTVRPFLAEKITAYEVGTKNDFFGNRLRVNVSAYHYKYEDIQRTQQVQDPVLGILSTTGNASNATIDGIDVGINAQVTNEFRLDVAYGHVLANYQEFRGLTNFRNLAIKDLEFARVPKDTLTVGGTFDMELANEARINFRVSAAYQAPYFYEDANLIQQKGYTLVDSQLQYTLPGGKSTVSVWGKNLTEAHYASWGSSGGAPYSENYFLGAPRTYGVRFSHKFF